MDFFVFRGTRNFCKIAAAILQRFYLEVDMQPSDRLETILKIFQEINAIPRCSKKEERIARYLTKRAEDAGFSVRRDAVGNLSIRVPAVAGCEGAQAVVLQGHMDMVCEKRSDSIHDFSKDPIRMHRDGDWLKADGTTLGADNGIALALALALAEDESLSRPPLELLFTVDEETGLSGANGMEKDLVQGRILLNLDSEDEGIFTVGCAGGMESRIKKSIDFAPIEPDAVLFHLEAGGMRGGHSGVDIHKQRANAIHILVRALDRIGRVAGIRLAAIEGGKSHNAIPRHAWARFSCAGKDCDTVQEVLLSVERAVRMEHADSDPSLRLNLQGREREAAQEPALAPEASLNVVRLLLALPDGVQAMSQQLEGLVETSCNLAKVSVEKEGLEIVTSQRSSVMSRLEDITRRVEAVAALAGAESTRLNAYPTWEPNLDSPLLARCIRVYRDLFGAEPAVEAVHAGLECAVIGAKYPEMDMISFGPTIRDPHSPDEALHLPSVEKVWEFLETLVASFAEHPPPDSCK
jgi:dipeptidase D